MTMHLGKEEKGSCLKEMTFLSLSDIVSVDHSTKSAINSHLEI